MLKNSGIDVSASIIKKRYFVFLTIDHYSMRIHVPFIAF